jgi:hypothetical protein
MRWEPLLRDCIALAKKLEQLGFRYSNGKVVIIEELAEVGNV